jgi:pimeloyl-ACP methyl ester carboxylesterase
LGEILATELVEEEIMHGSLAQSGMWIVPAETAGSIHMLYPDQRGYGLSEDPGGDGAIVI